MSEIPGYSSGQFGPDNKKITFTIENDTNLDRTEVVGVMALFPDGADGILPEDIGSYYMYLEGGRETIGFGVGNSYQTNYTYQTTIPWVGAMNGVTAGTGNIQPGSCTLTYVYYGYGPTSWPTGSLRSDKITLVDTQVNSTTGQFVHPGIVSSSINYTTGVVNIQFSSNYGPSGDLPIRLTYRFATPTKYPTQWTILRTWPTGRVRQAKAWIGQASGVGMLIPKKIQTITTTPSSTQTKEYTRGYLRIGYDPAVNTALPTYTPHASLATALTYASSNLTSEIIDVQGNGYYSSLLDFFYEQNIVEDPANNGGKGWMKVYQRRGYHTPNISGNTFSGSTRDLFSLTSYLYVPHNSRIMEVETRLGNDYQGSDPLEHTMTEALGTGNGSQKAFFATMTHTFPSADGRHGHLRQGKVKVYVGSTLVAWDRRGNGVLQAQGGALVSGSVDYATGGVSVNFTNAPVAGASITCSYNTYYLRVGLASGVATVEYTLPTTPSQYGVHVRVGGGGSALYEGWDGGTYRGASKGDLVPYTYTKIDPGVVVNAPLSLTSSGTILTNAVPGTVEFYAHTSTAGATSTTFCRDDGTGNLIGRNVTSGTIDYVTGAFSITFSSTPATNLNLYAKYGRTTSARYISGSVNYGNAEISINIDQSVPANTPVFVSYIPNNLTTGYYHDPNMHPLGSAGFQRWSIYLDGTKFTDHMTEGGVAYSTVDGGTTTRYSIFVNNGVTSGGGADPWVHEYLHDGASVSRLMFIYAGTGASAGDNNTWAAKKIHTIQTIPTLDAYNNSRAYGLLEGALNFVTPEQTFDWIDMTKRNFSEDIARRPSLLTVPYPNPWVSTGGSNGYYFGYALNKSNELSAVDSWNEGNPKGSGVGAAGVAEGVRNHLKWMENVYTGVNQGGAPRALHDSSIYYLYAQAWQGVRYMYHASMFNVVRPGTMLWNFAGRSRWNDRGYHVYIPTSPAGGMLITSTPQNSNYESNSQERLGRGWKYGWSNGTVSVTNGSNIIYFSSFAGQPSNNSILDNWNQLSPTYANGGSYQTPVGTGLQNGKRRIAFAGSTEVYTVTNVYYDTPSGRWAAQLNKNAIVNTSAAAQFAMFTDPVPGQDIVQHRNDPRIWPELRLACNVFQLQHGIEGESSSHQALNSAFDCWGTTGSWALWDIVRHAAEWNMVSMKEYVLGVFRQDQMRTSAWTARAVLAGYSVVKDLAGKPGFAFLSDPSYGRADARLKEWLQIRWTQWCNYGAKGQMDPNNTIAVNGKEKFADIRVTSSSDKGDWFAMSDVGSPNPAYGGAGFFDTNQNRWVGPTEGQVRFDDNGFTYVSVWEIGYLTPWMAATYREFRFDTTPVDMPDRGEYGVPFAQVMERIFNGYAILITDYGWITQQMNFTVRGYPGMFAASTFGNPAFPEISNKWGPIMDPAIGTPIRFVTNPATPANSIRPYYGTINWPSSDINNFAAQVYWLRGASRTLGSTQAEDIDRLGWPLPNRGGYTSFELLDPSWKTGWHSPGIAFQGDPIIPANQTNPQTIGITHPRIRPNYHPEGCVLEGTESLAHRGTALSWSTTPFLMMIARFHSNPARRALAGEILNRVIWQSMAMSLIKGVYDQPNSSEYNKGGPIEFNYFAGPITGDFPYATDTGSQPIDRWWNTSYVNRRKLLSGTSHEAHVAGQDVFSIDLSLYSVEDRLLQSAGTDIRVVRQLADGTYQVCSSIVRKGPTDKWTLYVAAPIGISANQPIPSTSNASEAWYLYYGSASSTQASWSNTNSIDGPYASDVSTRVLWNQDGNYAVDAGPNNWPIGTFASLEPDYVVGPFGGAIGVDYLGGDVAYSFEASQVVRVGSPYNLGGSFTFDFKFQVQANRFEVDQAYMYGLFSALDTGIYPILCYLDGPSKQIVSSISLGTTGTGFNVTSVSGAGPTRTVIGTGNNILTSFTSNIGVNRTPGTVAVTTSTGSINGVDDGFGNITGTGIAGGSTVNYSSGAITVVTSAAVAMGVSVVAYSTNTTAAWSLNGWNHVSISYNGSRVLLAINGVQVGTVVASGVIQSIPVESITGFTLGALFTPADFFIARSAVKIAEFRVSSTDRGVPKTLGNKLETSLLAEETLLTTSSVSAPVIMQVAGVSSVTAPVVGYMATSATTLTLPVALDIITGQNLTSTATADANIAVSALATAPVGFAVQVSDLAVTNTVSMSMAAVFQTLVTGVGNVATQGSLNAQIATAIQLAANLQHPVSGIIGNLTTYSLGVEGVIMENNSSVQVLAPVALAVSLVNQSTVNSASGNVASVTGISNPVTGSVAVQQIATNAGQPFTANLAVQLNGVTTTQSVSGVVAGSMIDSPVVADVASTVAGLGTVTATAAMDVLTVTQQRSQTAPAALAIQVTSTPYETDATGSVALQKLVQSDLVVGAIQVTSQVLAPVITTIQLNNVSSFVFANLAIALVGQIYSQDTGGNVATRGASSNPAALFLYTAGQVILPVSLQIISDSTGVGVDCYCAVSTSDSVTQDVSGLVVPTETVELPVEISLADIRQSQINASLHVSGTDMVSSIDCDGILAITDSFQQDSDGLLAVTRFEIAIARGLIVLPLTQSLNASGVDTTTSQG